MNFFKITNFIKSIFFISFIITLQSCNSNKFIVDKKTNQDEAFIRPPSNFLARNIKFDSQGKIRNDKSVIIINKFDLEVQKEEDKRFSSKKIFKSKRSGFGESWVKKTKDSIYNGLLDKPLHVYLYYTGKEINFYTVWNYNALYDTSSPYSFDIANTLKTIDELRVLISDLTLKGIDIKTTTFENISITTNLNNVNSYESEILLKEGNEQEILNYFFSNLTLPLSLSLYNYGYVDEISAKYDIHPAYILDHNFSLSMFYHKATGGSQGNTFTKYNLHSANTFNIVKKFNKLTIENQWKNFDFTSTQDSIVSTSLDLNPQKFYKKGKDFFIVYNYNKENMAGHINTRAVYFYDNLLLIGINDINKYYHLKHHPSEDTIQDTLSDMIQNSINPTIYHLDVLKLDDTKFYYTIGIRVISKYDSNFYVEKVIPFGSTFEMLYDESFNLNIKRLKHYSSNNKKYKKVKIKCNSIGNLLILPSDKISL
ncbi:hypothetical protein [Aquimarina macrocephali]|uniref:hypothetical protein n=1 Tax=Aquimarina macrocephali TaxID=666563 RepID=UPI003F671063